MALPSGLPQISDLGALNGILDNNIVDISTTIPVPFTSIIGRAQISNIANNLKAQMGIERIMTQQIYQLQNEFGPNGESVFAVVNDDRGLIRFVGNWSSSSLNIGSIVTGSSANDYLEFTFYGTGLNILLGFDGSSRDYRITIDGGTEGLNAWPSVSGSNVLYGRNYAFNSVVNLVSGLTLGIHTVKIRNGGTGASVNLYLFGFEIINESSSIKVNSGSSYVGGKKLTSSIQSSLPYNSDFESGTLGTKGGRVIVYQKPDGTVAKTVQSVNAIQTNLTLADHTNEEVSRVYSLREFGAGRTDDFSFVSGIIGIKAFTLDDGTTTLSGDNLLLSSISGVDALGCYFAGNFFSVTFVGTGFDIYLATETAANVSFSSYNVIVNGVSIGSPVYTIGTTSHLKYKIVSGLPYGTHTVKFSQIAVNASRVYFSKFVIYQPKKPTLPSGAIELADYNIMGNYIATTLANPPENISTGSLRKMGMREIVYVGAWYIAGLDVVNFSSGWNIQTTTAGSYFQYTFFGTGIEWAGFYNAQAVSQSITIDGNSNLSAYTTNLIQPGTGVTLTPSTGIISGTSSAALAMKLQINGLPLGLHTIKVTQNNANSTCFVGTLDIITPIHSAKSNIYSDLQNTLLVGSQGISDNRKLSVNKNTNLQQKAVSQAIGVINTPTTTATAPVPCPDLSCTIKTSGARIRISYSMTFSVNIVATGYFGIYVDGIAVGTQKSSAVSSGSYEYTIGDILSVPVAAGIHKIDIYWYVNSGTMFGLGTRRNLLVEEA